MTPEELQGLVLYKDPLILVLNKPAGLPVHPGFGGGETLSDHLDALRYGLPRRPELAHRLDRDTSGCLVLGRHRKALMKLGKLFERGGVEKTYLAVVEGGPKTEDGLIDLALAPQTPGRGWHMKPDPAGQSAETLWRVLGRGSDKTLLELKPLTGRTHQLRVHCAASGFPIVGDRIYGAGGDPLHLHAWRIALPLYPSRDAVSVEAPLPYHLARTLDSLKLPHPSPT